MNIASKALVAGSILLAFTAYSLWVVFGYGYTGFLSLAAREPWAMQMLIDLVIACSFGIGWMVADAKRRTLATWPFVVATIFLGSIGLLGYVVWRGVRGPANEGHANGQLHDPDYRVGQGAQLQAPP